MEVEGVKYVIDCSMFTLCLQYVSRQLELRASAEHIIAELREQHSRLKQAVKH